MTADSLTTGQYLNLVKPDFLSFLVFVSRDFELERTWLAGGVDRQSRTGLFFFTDCDLKYQLRPYPVTNFQLDLRNYFVRIIGNN